MPCTATPSLTIARYPIVKGQNNHGTLKGMNQMMPLQDTLIQAELSRARSCAVTRPATAEELAKYRCRTRPESWAVRLVKWYIEEVR
jgi:hypothetical protein